MNKKIKKAILSILGGILLIIAVYLSIECIPYFIPNTPKYVIRKFCQSINKNDIVELSKCYLQTYDENTNLEGQDLHFTYAKKLNLSEKEIEFELYRIKTMDPDKFEYLQQEDILKYKTDMYTNSFAGPPNPIITLVRNKFDKNKYKWVVSKRV